MDRKIKRYLHSSFDKKSTSKDFEKKSYVVYQSLKDSEKLETYIENSFAITLFERGTGTCTINGANYEVKPKQIHLQFPEQQQRWKLKPGVDRQRLIIKKALVETFSNTLQFTFSHYNQHPVLNLDSATYKKIKAEFLAINKELTSRKIFLELVNAKCRLIALIITLWIEHKFKESATVSISGSLAYKFHSLVEHHFKTQKSISFYAKQLCITPNYLGVICRKQYKMSALDLIQERVLLEAKRLLHSSDRLIKEIAFDLGFKNLAFLQSKNRVYSKRV